MYINVLMYSREEGKRDREKKEGERNKEKFEQLLIWIKDVKEFLTLFSQLFC